MVFIVSFITRLTTLVPQSRQQEESQRYSVELSCFYVVKKRLPDLKEFS